MILPTNNISIMDVRNSLGCPSTDLGTLCAKAKTGGTLGYAFNIIENGSYSTNGKLIANARPYWNIWSNASPGQWRLPADANQELYFELKRDSNNKYIFSLGSFRGYNSNARVPVPPSADLQFYRNGNIPLKTNILLKANLGEYDWTKLSGISKCKVIVYDGSSIFAQTEAVTIQLNQLISIGVLPLTINMSSEYTKEYPVRIALCSSDGNEMGWLPVEGSITIKVSNTPKSYVGAIYIDGNRKVFRLNEVVDTHVNATYTGLGGISANGKQLKQMIYEKVDLETNVVLQSLTVTSFNINEYPLMLDVYKVNDVETFWFSDQRLFNNPNGTYIRVNWYYE